MKKIIEEISGSKAKKFRVSTQFGISLDSPYNQYNKISKAEAIKQVKNFYKELFRLAAENEYMPQSYITVYEFDPSRSMSVPHIIFEKSFKEF